MRCFRSQNTSSLEVLAALLIHCSSQVLCMCPFCFVACKGAERQDNITIKGEAGAFSTHTGLFLYLFNLMTWFFKE